MNSGLTLSFLGPYEVHEEASGGLGISLKFSKSKLRVCVPGQVRFFLGEGLLLSSASSRSV